MKRKVVVLGIVSGLFLGLLISGILFAQTPTSGILDSNTTNYKKELAEDKQAIKAQKDEIKSNAETARAEEKNLREQIHQAMESGDKATADSLKEQLRAIHRENVGQMQADKQELGELKSELNSDRQEAENAGVLLPRLPPRKDNDNNPPGAAGGPGTNWENPPGAAGGPGAGPNRGGPQSGGPRGGGGGNPQGGGQRGGGGNRR